MLQCCSSVSWTVLRFNQWWLWREQSFTVKEQQACTQLSHTHLARWVFSYKSISSRCSVFQLVLRYWEPDFD
jgi:hypothetical protein